MNLPQFFEIGTAKIDNLFKILCYYNLRFKNILLMGDEKTFAIGGNKIASDFKRQRINVRKASVLNSDEPEVLKIKRIIVKEKPDLVVGFGGGKVLDVAKLAAGYNHIKFVSVPTILSNDGIASPVSVIKDKKGIPISHLTRPPDGVVVDIDTIKRAPTRHLKAGVGDLISNLSAVFDARLAKKKGIEELDDNALSLAEAGPIELLKCNCRNIKSNEFLKCLTQGLIKSGLAMCLVGSSRPASGSEHKISHSIDYLYPYGKGLHGEQVGIATIFTMALQDNKFLNQVKKLYTKINFPQRLKYLSLTPEEFNEVVLNACNIRPGRWTILEGKNLTEKEIERIIKTTKL